MVEYLLYFLVFIIGCIVGCFIGFQRYDLQFLTDGLNPLDDLELEDYENIDIDSDNPITSVEDLNQIVYFKRTTINIEDIPYELNESYFIKDKDGYGYSISKELYERFNGLFDGDEYIEIWFYQRGYNKMYREIIDVGLMSMIEPQEPDITPIIKDWKVSKKNREL